MKKTFASLGLSSSLVLFGASLALTPLASVQAQTPQPAVYFAAPANGVTVTSPFMVKFGVTGMLVKPSGDMTPDTGHYHLIINDGPVKKGDIVPADEHHIHYGKGQTEAEISLPPGTYSLTVQFADGLHKSYGADLSKTITVTVK